MFTQTKSAGKEFLLSLLSKTSAIPIFLPCSSFMGMNTVMCGVCKKRINCGKVSGVVYIGEEKARDG